MIVVSNLNCIMGIDWGRRAGVIDELQGKAKNRRSDRWQKAGLHSHATLFRSKWRREILSQGCGGILDPVVLSLVHTSLPFFSSDQKLFFWFFVVNGASFRGFSHTSYKSNIKKSRDTKKRRLRLLCFVFKDGKNLIRRSTSQLEPVWSRWISFQSWYKSRNLHK